MANRASWIVLAVRKRVTTTSSWPCLMVRSMLGCDHCIAACCRCDAAWAVAGVHMLPITVIASINPRAVRGATVTGLPPQFWVHYREAKGLPGCGLAAVFQASLAYRPAVSRLLPDCKRFVRWCKETLTLRIP